MSLQNTLIENLDLTLRTIFSPTERVSPRQSPADTVQDIELSNSEKKHISGLMRVNHSGEVCAQALYQGQALTAKLEKVRSSMQHAADEEVDHLAWCEKRLNELGSKPSILNPFWYMGSFIIGATAGYIGDKYSLGFVAETEKQVTDHLQSHISKVPLKDKKTHYILNQMKIDEQNHAETALLNGGIELPFIIKKGMGVVSKIMTNTSYYI